MNMRGSGADSSQPPTSLDQPNLIGNDNRSQADQAYDVVKSDIIHCTLRPNARLTENELVERYGFGRAAIRVALNRLSEEALVEAIPRFGYIVAGDDEFDRKDLHELQLILEPAAAALAAGRVDATHLLELDERCRSAAASVESVDDARAYLQANIGFHTAVAHATGNSLLARFVRILFERMQRQVFAGPNAVAIARNAAHTHEDLIRHLVDGNAEAAEQTARDQVERIHRRMIEASDRA